MVKSKVPTTTSEKSPRTIKVKTLVIAIAVVIGLIASYIGGIATANSYNDTVKAQAIELSKEFSLKENQ